MSRSNPKFNNGDIVQVISNKSKYKGMFGKFEGYTTGQHDNMCKVEIGLDVVFLMETSIKLIKEKHIANIYYTEIHRNIEEEIMQHEKNIEVKYEGKHIRIGVHKLNGNTYMQQLNRDTVKNLWFRFEPEYYLDYKEYIKEYCDYLKEEATYPDLGYNKILDGETLEHYIALFSADEVYINHQCVYSTKSDVTYTKAKYIEDMTTHMIPNKYYPFINNINISIDDTTKDITIHFAVTLRYEEI